MFGLKSNMSGVGRIFPVWEPDMSNHKKLHAVEKLIGRQDDASSS
jgi:hypothetical protein